MPYNERRLNVRRIVRHFGGRTSLHRLLKNNGIKLSIKSVEAWMTRNSIPSNRLATLVSMGKEAGKPIVLDEFLEDAETHTPPAA